MVHPSLHRFILLIAEMNVNTLNGSGLGSVLSFLLGALSTTQT